MFCAFEPYCGCEDEVREVIAIGVGEEVCLPALLAVHGCFAMSFNKLLECSAAFA